MSQRDFPNLTRCRVLSALAYKGLTRNFHFVDEWERAAIRDGITRHWSHLARRGNHRGLLSAMASQRGLLAAVGGRRALDSAFCTALRSAIVGRMLVTLEKLLGLPRDFGSRVEDVVTTLMIFLSCDSLSARKTRIDGMVCLAVVLESPWGEQFEDEIIRKNSAPARRLLPAVQRLMSAKRRWSRCKATWVAAVVATPI